MIHRILLVLFLVIPKITKPQSVSTLMGARSASLGNASVTLSDGWSIFNNIGGLAKIPSATANFTYALQPSLPGTDRAAFTFAAPLGIGVFGGGIFRFGDELYSEQILTAGYANQLGLASLGLKANYIQYRAEGFDTRSVVSLSFGGVAELSPTFLVGAHIVNLNQPKLSSTEDERLPAKLITGVQFHPDNNLILLLELEKDIDYEATVKGGVEYKFYKKVDFRAGFNLNPNTVSCGVGYQSSWLSIDYGIQYNPVTQAQYQISTGYKFKKANKE
jgi:hypothetical protein